MKTNEITIANEGQRTSIERSIDYMVRHLDQPLQVATLAGTVHVSPSHFFTLFKRCVGYSPIDYFIRLRMHQAGRLLTETSLSVKEVAAMLGYEDPFYFSRVFKTVHGLSPHNFRQEKEETEARAGAAGNRSILHSPRRDLAARVSRIITACTPQKVSSRPLDGVTKGGKPELIYC
jgi:AraC-like DNA-binding protein